MTGVDGWAVPSEQVSRVSAMHVKRGNVFFPFGTKASARTWKPTAHPGRNLNHDGTAGQPRWSPQNRPTAAHSTASLFSQSAVVWQEPFLSVAFLGGITEKNARGQASAVCGRAHHVVLSGELNTLASRSDTVLLASECATPQARPNCAGIMPSVEARKRSRQTTGAHRGCSFLPGL